jgi:hypothetical protein
LAEVADNSGPNTYSESDLLEMLRECQDRYGSCTAEQFASDDDFCSPETVQRRFGSWSKAKIRAGIGDEPIAIEAQIRGNSCETVVVEFDDQALDELADRIAQRLQARKEL